MDAFVDSSVLIDIYRGYPPAVAWVQSNPSVTLGITSITWLETIRGAENKIVQKRVATFLMQFQIAYIVQADQEWVAAHFPNYWLSHGVGILDCLIAAPSYRLQLPLYTRNLKHFIPLLGKLAQQPY